MMESAPFIKPAPPRPATALPMMNMFEEAAAPHNLASKGLQSAVGKQNRQHAYQPTSSREWNRVVIFGIAVATIDVSSSNRKTTRTVDTNTLSSVRPVRYAASSSFLGGDDVIDAREVKRVAELKVAWEHKLRNDRNLVEPIRTDIGGSNNIHPGDQAAVFWNARALA
ncbi:hypothetical protein KCV06_g119, partial [Aureobasidium melanogenum]